MPNIQTKAVSLPVLIVTDFGAKGNGVVDDTAAINAAIAAAEDGQMIFFPKGTYKISSGLVIDKPIILQGVLSPIAFKGSIIYKTGDFVGITLSADDIIIRDLGLDSIGSSVDSSYGILSRYRCILDNVAVRNQGNDGIYMHQAASADDLSESYLKVYLVNNGMHGLEIVNDSGGDDNLNRMVIIVPQAEGNFFNGIEMENGDSDLIIATSKNNGVNGVHINSSRHFGYIRTEGNGSTGFVLDSNSENNFIVGRFADLSQDANNNSFIYDAYVHGMQFPQNLFNAGVTIGSGDGVTTDYSFPHGLKDRPTQISVVAGTADAASPFYISSDTEDIIVTYLTAPPSGTDNVKLYWTARITGIGTK